jgi:hypothetical protein
MQPDKASAVMTAIIEYRNARATRTGAIPHNETAPVLHRLWLINRVCPCLGRGAALFQQRTIPGTGVRYGPGFAAHRFAKSGALRCVRGMVTR